MTGGIQLGVLGWGSIYSQMETAFWQKPQHLQISGTCSYCLTSLPSPPQRPPPCSLVTGCPFILTLLYGMIQELMRGPVGQGLHVHSTGSAWQVS